MKFNSLEALTLEPQGNNENQEVKQETAGEKSATGSSIKKVDRRPSIVQKSPDEKLLAQTQIEILNATGHIPNAEEVYEEALRSKFQGMSYEEFADRIIDALTQDETFAKQITDQANKELADVAQEARFAPLREYSNEDLAKLAVIASARDGVMAREITKRVNQSLSQRRRGKDSDVGKGGSDTSEKAA